MSTETKTPRTDAQTPLQNELLKIVNATNRDHVTPSELFAIHNRAANALVIADKLYEGVAAHQAALKVATDAVGLAVDLVERDVICVRPSERQELMDALTIWNKARAAIRSASKKGAA